MRAVLLLACVVLVASCAQTKPVARPVAVDKPTVVKAELHLAKGKVFEFPPLNELAIDPAKQLDRDGAKTLTWHYFSRYISTCGGTGEPQSVEDFWHVPVYYGIGGSDFGFIWLKKDGSRVLLEPLKSKVAKVKKLSKILHGHE